MFAQIVLGAWLRHSGAAIALSAHLLLALGVVAAVIVLTRALAAEGAGADDERRPLLSVRRWLRSMLWAQVALGVAATVAIFFLGEGFAGAVTVTEAVAATLHVGVGALLLAGSLASVLWTLRLRRPAQALAPAPSANLEGGVA